MSKDFKEPQFRVRLRPVHNDYLEDYMIINDYKTKSAALNDILKEHKELNKNNWNLQYISHTVAEIVNDRISNELNRVRLGTNNTDRNTQILIELLQGYMELQNVQHIPTTDMYKPEFLCHTEEVVRSRITKMKQRKDSKVK
ncbi:hypothetical protein D5F11_008450 [Siminovitchia terrae]|uniref:Uncharacterized protein n=1 Tax=Siminovitchia terrae TaxID=1914933 RepID=A0A429X9N7_SIMTE|nr:hypothetical protein [Siminovitchia terrae]RST60086.1 hypothetical protein D5F11_008450 [Siminovitchia terrae]